MLQIWDASRCRRIRTMDRHRLRVELLHVVHPHYFPAVGIKLFFNVIFLRPEDFVSRLAGHKLELFLWNQQSTRPLLKYSEHTTVVKDIAWWGNCRLMHSFLEYSHKYSLELHGHWKSGKGSSGDNRRCQWRSCKRRNKQRRWIKRYQYALPLINFLCKAMRPGGIRFRNVRVVANSPLETGSQTVPAGHPFRGSQTVVGKQSVRATQLNEKNKLVTHGGHPSCSSQHVVGKQSLGENQLSEINLVVAPGFVFLMALNLWMESNLLVQVNQVKKIMNLLAYASRGRIFLVRTDILLRNLRGKAWKVVYTNSLEVGDLCAFELVGEIEPRVHIFRVVEETTPLALLCLKYH